MRRKKAIDFIIYILIFTMLTGCTGETEEKDAVIEKEKTEKENGLIQEAEKQGWTLTFSDDFDGTELDKKKWRHAPEWERHDGQWSHQEAFVNGKGQLIIQVSERDGKYYSGAIRTKDLFEQAYGYFEIRAKIPKEEGFWTAFWLMSDSVHQVGNEGKDGTEVDILETPFAKDGEKIQHALHWDGYEDEHQSTFHVVDVPNLYEDYHTFALEWNEEEYIFYVDEEETWRTSAGGVSEVPAYVKITAEVGRWAGYIQNANLPAQLEVDYMRVYERDT